MNSTKQDLTDLSTWLTLKECANRLPRRDGQKVSLASLYRWAKSGKLPAVRINRTYYVHPEDLADLAKPVEARQRQAPSIPTSRTQRAWDKQVEEGLKRHGLA